MKTTISVILALLVFNFSNAQEIKVRKLPQTVATNSGKAFRVSNSSELPIVAQSKESIIVFDKEYFDDANAFNSTSYKVPADGIYQFTMQLGLKAKNNSSNISQVMLQIKTNSQSATQLINIPAVYDNVITAQANALFKLKAGEEVSVVMINLGPATAVTTGNLNIFSGIKLQ